MPYYADLRGLNADEVIKAIAVLIGEAQGKELENLELHLIDAGADGAEINAELEQLAAWHQERRAEVLIKVRALVDAERSQKL
jgi:hypothetical protein